mmetsp:Transcript_54171/g.128997  ORF Transcript_54171/g.128997 Transcript_54171/m.128997 type:complete len:209 (-) Transcript_54171:62-688(-)
MSDYGRRSTLNRLQKAQRQGYGPLAPGGRSFVVNGSGRTTSPPRTAALMDRPATSSLMQMEVRRSSTGGTVASTFGARPSSELRSAERQKELAAKVTQQLELMRELKTKSPKEAGAAEEEKAASPAKERSRSRSQPKERKPAAAQPGGREGAGDPEGDGEEPSRHRRRRREGRGDGELNGDEDAPHHRERSRRARQEDAPSRARRSSR